MAALDNGLVRAIIPYLQVDPNFVPPGDEIPTSIVQWVEYTYSIGFGSFAIPLAKLNDRCGLKLMGRIGIILFILVTILCGCMKYVRY